MKRASPGLRRNYSVKPDTEASHRASRKPLSSAPAHLVQRVVDLAWGSGSRAGRGAMTAADPRRCGTRPMSPIPFPPPARTSELRKATIESSSGPSAWAAQPGGSSRWARVGVRAAGVGCGAAHASSASLKTNPLHPRPRTKHDLGQQHVVGGPPHVPDQQRVGQVAPAGSRGRAGGEAGRQKRGHPLPTAASAALLCNSSPQLPRSRTSPAGSSAGGSTGSAASAAPAAARPRRCTAGRRSLRGRGGGRAGAGGAQLAGCWLADRGLCPASFIR